MKKKTLISAIISTIEKIIKILTNRDSADEPCPAPCFCACDPNDPELGEKCKAACQNCQVPGADKCNWLQNNGWLDPSKKFLKKSTETDESFAPDPAAKLNGTVTTGVTDTTNLGLQYGVPDECGNVRPHFNWIIATCEGPDDPQDRAPFCSCLPDKLQADGQTATQINYLAAYQFVNDKGNERWELMEDSSCGDKSDPTKIQGNFKNPSGKRGWEDDKKNFQWKGGDWRTKYAPSSKDGISGPRGGTPPAIMYVLSAESFAYGAWYFLSQLNLNREMHDPGKPNCWTWEYDPVEGTAGWIAGFDTAAAGAELPGGQSINVMYNTSSSQPPGSMLVPFTNQQNNNSAIASGKLQYPEYFQEACQDPKQSKEGMCDLSKNVFVSGGQNSTTRMQNDPNKPYIFIVVIDQQGYWLYRYRTDTNKADRTRFIYPAK